MPTIRIDYDDGKLKDSDILELSNAVQKIVSEITGIEDTFVYANSSHIKVNIAPIEIFVQMSVGIIPDTDEMLAKIKAGLSEWKKANNFKFPINLTLMPMQWKFEIGI